MKLYWHLLETRQEYNLSGQILSSGTSVGANIEEAIGASSRKDFKHRLDIAYREARETRYWLRLLRDSNGLELKLADSLLVDCEELLKILGSILKTLKTEPKKIPN